ncbi:DNA (cytosine-5-)-methyltransferase [Lactococcus formosensis subsp. bovis]|uniref:DNA (cytosine-5-)-methyltransferase n=1 Tax=Lactococcus formosensis TaxID=1281486 RepID=UPI001BCE7C80|nr:DNA (cytosine-5-)-methyltransferase [Lactococcus formosensis]
MKFLDLFAGIGGFRLGMESAGHECVGFCEIDKFARKSYKAVHNTEGEREYHDITAVSDEEWRELRGAVDVICGGFPCQAFSVAGKRKGFRDKTRGTLFFEIARAAEQIKPRILFLENVKGLLSHDKGRTFRIILSTLDELGYNVEWQLLNSKNFGVPQNRERVFIIGHLRGSSGREIFPITGESTGTIKRVVNGRETHGHSTYDVLDSNGICTTLLSRDYKEPKHVAVKVKEATKKGYAIAEQGDSINFSVPNSKTRRGRVGKGIAQTLDTQCNQAVIVQKPRGFNKGGEHEIAPTLSANSWHENNLLKSGDIGVRKLTPRECWRLQGFPDWAFDKAQEVNSNSQLYKQAGNSVTVNVIAEIARRLE